MENDLKILKVEYLWTTIWIVTYEEILSAQPSLLSCKNALFHEENAQIFSFFVKHSHPNIWVFLIQNWTLAHILLAILCYAVECQHKCVICPVTAWGGYLWINIFIIVKQVCLCIALGLHILKHVLPEENILFYIN